MRILLINASDTKGGAAQVGWNLLEGLRERGHEVELWVGKKSSDSPWVRQLPSESLSPKRTLRSRVMHRLGVTVDLQSSIPRQLDASEMRRFDVIHLHDLPAWNWRHFRWLANLAPTVWTIHSMAPFTGNCIYSFGCERFQNACGRCPQHGHWPLLWNHRDGSRLNLSIKTLLLRWAPLKLIGVSEWISEQCRRSRLFRTIPVETIPNAVNPCRFYPVDRDEARKRLGIPLGARAILLSVSGNTLDTRKGHDIARKALADLGDQDLFLLPMGITPEGSDLRAALSVYNGLQPRHVSDDATLRDYYSAADIVWHPSRADTSSMVALEAFACGTSVIAAAVGGVPEVVTADLGHLIPSEDPAALCQLTRSFFNDCGIFSNRIGATSASKTGKNFTRFIDEHEKTYRAMIS